GYARGADERVDLFLEKQVEEFRHEQATGGGDGEGDDAQADDHERLRFEEVCASHGDAHGGAQEYGDDVDDLILRGLDQALGDQALAEEVAQHEHADQRGGGGHQQDAENGDHHGEDEFLQLGDFSERLHADAAFLRAGEGAHDGRLDE